MITRTLTYPIGTLLALSLFLSTSPSAQTLSGDIEARQSTDAFTDQSAGAATNDKTPLSAGDIVSVKIKNVDEMSGQYTIDENGDIDFPLIGKVSAQGQTAETLGAEITVLYERDYLFDPTITVAIFAKRFSEEVPAEPLTQPFAVLIDNSPVQIFPEVAPVTTPNEQSSTTDLAAPNEALFSQAESIPPSEDLPASVELNPSNVSNFDAQPVEYVEPIENTLLSEAYTQSPFPALEGSQWSIEGSSENFIHFLDNQEMAGALSCNNFFARYDASQSDINFHTLTVTSIQCADQSKPQEFIDNLKQTQSYLFSDNNLLLLDNQSQVIFTLQPK